MIRIRHTIKYLLFTTGFLITLFTLIVIALGLTNFSVGVDAELIEKYLSEQIQRPVRIESINTRWNGFLAEVEANGVRVLRQDGNQSSLRLRRLNISIDPLTLFSEQVGLEYIVVSGLVMQVHRRLDGSIQIGDLATGQKPGPNPALEWLLGQPRTEIRQAELTWVDQRDPGRPLLLNEINMEIENDGSEIRFEGQAALPQNLGKPVRINGEIRGQPLRSGLWDGRIKLVVDQLRLDNLPLVLTQALPWDTAGMLHARIDTEWLDGHLIEADGHVRLSAFEIPFEGGKKVIPVDEFSSSISWQHNLKNWRLVFEDPGIDINGHILRSKRFVVGRTNQTRTYYVDALKLDQVVDVTDQLQFEIPWHEIAAQVKGKGRFEAISVVTRGPFLSPDHWRAEARFSGLSWRPFSGIPGVTGAKGSMVIEPEAGNVRLDGTGVKLDLPDTLREPLYFNRYRSDISWARRDDGWTINVDDLDLNNSDIQALRGRATLRVPAAGSALPYIDSQFTVAKLDVDKLTRYLPTRKASAWLDKALLQGSFTDARIELKGDLNQFPFRTGGGSFYVSSRVLDARLHYADRWSDIDDIYGSLSINNAAMHGEISSAQIRNSRVRNAVVESSDLFRRDNELDITASLVSPAQDVVEFLTEGPLIKNKSVFPLQAAGNGDLMLELFLPLSNLKNGVKVAGRYAVKNAELLVADRFSFEGLNGVVDFTESTVESSAMTGSLLGGHVTLDIDTVKAQQPPVWRVRAQGELDSAELVPVFQSRLIQQHVAGRAAWSGTLVAGGDTAQLEINSDLFGVGISLPAPLSKVSDERRESTVRASYGPDKRLYQFESGPLKGSLEYSKSGSGPMIPSGVVALGKVEPGQPPAQGIRVEIRQPFLNADKWLAVLAADEIDGPAQPGAFQSALRVVELELDEVRFLSRNLGRTNARAISSNGREWKAWISGNFISGQITASLAGENEPNNYTMNFDRLHLPKPRGGRTAPDPSVTRMYPNVKITADHFVFGEWDLGRLDLKATSYVGRWRLDQFDVEQPGLQIRANGHWAYGEGGSGTQIKATVSSDDIEIALKQLSLPIHMAESKAELELVLEWPGDPQSFALDRLNGTYTATARSGRFLNVQPGSGRLLGLFNVDEISRRFSLDFSDIFSRGLGFDQIKGQGYVRNGDLYTDKLFVVAPSALIKINGRTGLVSNDYDLKVTVAPRISSQISMLSALANPIAGAMVFLAHKVFSKQLSTMIQYRYEIKGSWDSPEISSARREPEPEAEEETSR